MGYLTILFTTIGVKYAIPSNLLSSLCYVESRHNISAIHHDDGDMNSVGVCQVKLKTARDFGFKGTEKQLMNPKTNITYAAKYLSHQLKRYHGQVNKAVIAYNQGHAGNLETTKYQIKVFNQWQNQNILSTSNVILVKKSPAK